MLPISGSTGIYKYSAGIYTNMAIVGILAVVFLIVGSVVTRWKEK